MRLAYIGFGLLLWGQTCRAGLPAPALSFEQTCQDGRFAVRGTGYLLSIGLGGQLEFFAPASQAEAEMATLEWVSANHQASPQGTNELPGKVHTIIGSNPAGWCLDRSTYSQVTVPDLYPGVSLAFHESDSGFPEFDLTIAANSSPAPILMRIHTPSGLWVDDAGNLLLNSTGSLRLQAPSAYQLQGAERIPVPARFVLQAGGDVSLLLGDYDRQAPLVIDPVIAFSTYVGGRAFDAIYGIASDAGGNVYVAGETYSLNFQGGSPQATKKSFVAKLNPAGNAYLYTTFFGGSGADTGRGIAIDGSGYAWVTGTTLSTDFPTPGYPYRSYPSGQ